MDVAVKTNSGNVDTSGGGGGWGSDRTAGDFELDEYSGEWLPTDETIDGIPWLIGRDLEGREVLRGQGRRRPPRI
jgi:hypothetical protein